MVFAFTDAFTICDVLEKMSYSVLFIRPSVDSPCKLDMRGISGPAAPILSVVRLTERLGHVESDGTEAIENALYGWNSMSVGDVTCRMEMQER